MMVWAVAVLAASAASASGFDTHRLERRLGDMDCPGAVVGIFPDDQAPVVAAIGFARVGTELPMQVAMRMRIGSVSKLFVGTAALRLADRGLLSLDDFVSDHVEGVPGGDRITIRMLGNQTSGLFDPIADPDFQSEIVEEPRRLWHPAEVLAYSHRHPLRDQPGAVFRYGNAGTIVLGQVMVAATGKPLPEIVRDEVCEPLRLKGTGFCRGASLPPPTPSAYRFGAEGRWLGYGRVFADVTGYSASWTSWAGDMYSTLSDLGCATRPLATGLLLSESSRAELHAWRTTDEADSAYGFLISRDDLGIGHDGDVPGFNAVVRYSASRCASLVVLTNLSNNADGSMPAEVLARCVWPNGARAK